ncbi:MAG: anti-sigma factor family protein [Actinomycetota bacterium]
MTPVEMNCRTLVELVTDYLEGALSEDEGTAVEAHLAECEGCTAYLEQFRTTIRLTGMLTEDQIPTETREALLRVFRSSRAAPPG